MKFILFIYLKTSRMKVNWKRVALYVLRIIEMVITAQRVEPSRNSNL